MLRDCRSLPFFAPSSNAQQTRLSLNRAKFVCGECVASGVSQNRWDAVAAGNCHTAVNIYNPQNNDLLETPSD